MPPCLHLPGVISQQILSKDVRLQSFSRTVDLDFDGAPLLEQYQAPIAAALTPAFSADSYPEVLSSAIQLCAVFIASGVVQEVPKMGRILKLLTSSLESCRGLSPTLCCWLKKDDLELTF